MLNLLYGTICHLLRMITGSRMVRWAKTVIWLIKINNFWKKKWLTSYIYRALTYNHACRNIAIIQWSPVIEVTEIRGSHEHEFKVSLVAFQSCTSTRAWLKTLTFQHCHNNLHNNDWKVLALIKLCVTIWECDLFAHVSIFYIISREQFRIAQPKHEHRQK